MDAETLRRCSRVCRQCGTDELDLELPTGEGPQGELHRHFHHQYNNIVRTTSSPRHNVVGLRT